VNRRHIQLVLRQAAAVGRPSESDADLLRRFAAERDEAAFAELVRRHGRLVWALCRNLLPSEADADDAFQATFLALARSPGSVRDGGRVGPWLHGVAYRVCLKSRRAAARRRKRERVAAAVEADRPVADSAWDTALAAVHEEVCRLPESQRVPFVLCCLEGTSVTEAATQLGWKLGTLSARLTRAKQTLIDRLTGRRLPAAVAGAVAVTGGVSSADIPASLVARTAELAFAAGPVSQTILSLAHGVTGMTLYRTKLLAVVLLAGGLTAGLGSGWLATAVAQQADKPGEPKPAAQNKQPADQSSDVLSQLAKQLDDLAVAQLATENQKQPASKWEYDVVLASEMGTTKFVEFLRDRETRGWEFNGQVTMQHEGKDLPHWVFRRPAARPAIIHGDVLHLQDAQNSQTLLLGEVLRNQHVQPNLVANRAKELEDQIKKHQITLRYLSPGNEVAKERQEDQIKKLQVELAKLKASAAPQQQQAFKPDELPLGASELADILRRLALKKYGFERLKFTVTTPGDLLTVEGDKEAFDWAVGIIQKLSGK
jgi:RNA polymerase sigma factor (sigma-70 family)